MSNSSSFFDSSSYQRTIKLSFIFSAFLSLSGLMFKIMHYPGSDFFLPIGLMLLSLVSILLIFESNPQEKLVDGIDFKLLTIYKQFLGWGSAIFSIGGLFYVQHYPGGQLMAKLGIIVGLCSLLLTIYITFFKRISLLSVSKLICITMLTFFIWGSSGYYMRVSKSILDSYVSLNDQIEQNAENELVFGNLKLELFKNKNTDVNLDKKLEYIDQIDKLTAEKIQYLDAIKIEILSEIKEDPTKMKVGDPYSIISNSFDEKNALRPIRMNLDNVMNKDKYDEVMRIFGIAENPNKPTPYKCKSSNNTAGIELWHNLLKYRGDLCSILVASSSSDSAKYSFVDPKINEFKDMTDLQKNVENAFNKCKINPEDLPFLEEIYISLTKKEIIEDSQYPEGLHWLSKTFNHAPSISAITSISILQKEILSARKVAISSIMNH